MGGSKSSSDTSVLSTRVVDRPGLVLVVDDEPSVRKILVQILETKQHKVLCASTGESAVQMALLENPDLLILDINLPDISGFDVCRMLKADPLQQHVPILMLTGMMERKMHLLSLECGAAEFLQKPIDGELLLARVRSLLKGKHTIDSLRKAQQRSSLREMDQARYMKMVDSEYQDSLAQREKDSRRIKVDHEKLIHLLDTIPSLVIGLDEQMQITHWNPEAAQCLGLNAEAVIGKSIGQCGVKWDHELIANYLQRCSETDPLRMKEDVWFDRVDGPRGFLGLTVVRIRGMVSSDKGFLVFGADISAIRNK